MARKVIVVKTDDLGSAGTAETVRFSFQGQDYEIDLNKRNAETLERRLQPYIAAGRTTTKDPEEYIQPGERSAIADWAQAQGLQIGLRGRVPVAVLQQYREAQQGQAVAVG